MSRSRKFELVCPVIIDEDGNLCEAQVTVWSTPGYPGSRDEPPTGPEIDGIEATHCKHQQLLEEGDFDEDFFNQIQDKEDASGY